MLSSFRLNMVRDLVKSAVLRILTHISPKNVSLMDFTLGDPINPNPKNKKNWCSSLCWILKSGICGVFCFRQWANSNLNEQCKLARAAFVNSNSFHSFTCPHCESRGSSSTSVHSTLTTEVISHYKADQSTKNRLFEVMNAVPFPHLYQLSESIFCAYGPPTSSIPIGFVHLTLANWKMDCSWSDCNGYGSVMRQEKKKKICIHCHALLCLYSVAMLMSPISSAQAEAMSGVSLPF